ncbi:MAG: thiamine pyrophosphate-binding protein, partial [Nanoarchaeota archaeon]
MKASDYIADFLVKQGVKYVFGVTGVAIIHLFDSIGKRRDIKYICTQHEQSAAMAADGYSRMTKNLGVAIATSGPGATNLITGTCCSYYDSIPVLTITGQVSTSRLKEDKKVRQIGFQETPITDMYKPITKYSVIIKNPSQLRYELEKAVYIAKSGRPGPVLVDIPDDIQRAEIDPDKLLSYIPKVASINLKYVEGKMKQLLPLIKKAERPIIILGAGIKLGRCEKEAIDFVKKLNFPVGLTWATKDMLAENDELNAGVFGVASPRCGNFAVQNSDLILALGTRMDQHHTGTPANTFAREAKKILVEIDEDEIKKFNESGLKWDIIINADINHFLKSANKNSFSTTDVSAWIKKIKEWKKRYPSCPKRYFKEKEINSYAFIEELSKKTKKGEILVIDTGGTLA